MGSKTHLKINVKKGRVQVSHSVVSRAPSFQLVSV